MMTEPVRVQPNPALLAPPHHKLVDPAPVQWAAVVNPQPQLGPVRQLVPEPDPQVSVQPPGGLDDSPHAGCDDGCMSGSAPLRWR